MAMNQGIISRTEDIAMRMRRSILEVALAAGGLSSHLGGGLSYVDISAALFGEIMNYNPNDPEWIFRDRFILSKGHGVLGYYTALYQIGVISKGELLSFEADGSFLLGHPVLNRKKGIEFSNGSLGMGLALGIGVAIANKRKNTAVKTYVVMGDGECNEGSVWEAVMSAAHFKLDNIVAIVDRNQLQQTGANHDIMSVGDAAKKFSAFGWYVKEINGHNHTEIHQALTQNLPKEQPVAIIAHTDKGHGFSFCENNNAWHHAVLSRSQYEQALEELPEQYRGETW